jgi:hypothetical protein
MANVAGGLPVPSNEMIKDTRLNWLFFVVLAAGIAVRMFVAHLGHDFDFESWKLIAGYMNNGQNVYVQTQRYAFAPAWFLILHGLDLLSGHNPVIFRYAVAGFLTLADVGIFFILWRKFGMLAGCWFFLNLISIIVSGYQNNLDNLGILSGLIAALLIKDDFEKPLSRRALCGLMVLGLSLVLKHVFFAFPFWLAVKQRGIVQKLIVMVIPISIFLLSFVPYWAGGSQGIIRDVFLYRSYEMDFFYHLYLPLFLQYMFSAQMIWFLCLVIFAFIYRQKSTLETMLLYTCVLVATSPASINEYLAIPLCFVATHLNFFTVLYTIYGSLHELVDYNGLQLRWISSKNCIDVAIYMLFPALLWVTWRQQIVDAGKKLLKWTAFEIENQLGLKK